MAISRYTFVSKYNLSNNVFYGTASYNVRISNAVRNGILDCHTHIISAGERLDQLAYNHYNDAKYWWVIAAASKIGWSLQVPPGTVVLIPKNLSTAIGAAQ